MTVGSVPGGFYSEEVAEAAAQAGIRMLFNSEPSIRLRLAGSCTVVGRYFVQRDTPAGVAAGYAACEWVPRVKQAAMWKAKRLAKAAGGDAWFRVREWAIARTAAPAAQPRAGDAPAERTRAA